MKGTTSIIETDIQLCEDINESSEDFQSIFKNREKVQNSLIETAVQERNISGSFPFRQCFYGDAEDRKEKFIDKGNTTKTRDHSR